MVPTISPGATIEVKKRDSISPRILKTFLLNYDELVDLFYKLTIQMLEKLSEILLQHALRKM